MLLEENIAYCGFTCNSCPIYWATMEPDKEIKYKMRVKIAQLCNENYGTNYTASDITDCCGCRRSSNILFAGCRNCEIRKCAMERKYPTCGHCPDYVCSKLESFFKIEKSGKILLDLIRSFL